MLALCRDCLADQKPVAPDARPRCTACGSPRLIYHPEQDALTIAHVDCDAFFAAVEKRDAPELRDKPVIVGGGRRGVVMTCCYIARTFGVRSAMPMFKALDACPQAVIVRPNMEKYATVGRQIRDRMRDLTPLVEPLSIDEAFLDLSGTRELHGAPAAGVLARFARGIETDIGITVSVGLSYNKFLAKIASDLMKPRGFSMIGRADATDFLASQPVTILPGVGAAMRDRLEAQGVTLIADLARQDPARLFAAIGSEATRLRRLSEGIDGRPVRPSRARKSVSAETTFNEDVSDPAELRDILLRLSEKVAQRLRRDAIAGSTVTLKLKTTAFELRTRARSGLPPTQVSGRIHDAACEMLARETDGTRFRLIGVGVSDLCTEAAADRGDLIDTRAPKDARRERAIDALRDRFGADSIQRASLMPPRRRGTASA